MARLGGGNAASKAEDKQSFALVLASRCHSAPPVSSLYDPSIDGRGVSAKLGEGVEWRSFTMVMMFGPSPFIQTPRPMV
jgi:hypothetical protein